MSTQLGDRIGQPGTTRCIFEAWINTLWYADCAGTIRAVLTDDSIFPLNRRGIADRKALAVYVTLAQHELLALTSPTILRVVG